METKDPQDSAKPAVAEKQEPEAVVVVLSHSSFGSYTFRAPEGKVQGAIPEALHAAKAVYARNIKVAEIDAKQSALDDGRARINERIKAAEVLGDTAAKAREERELERLAAASQAFAEQRRKLFEAF